MSKSSFHLTFVILCFFSLSALGQNATSSPYSRYGIGDVRSKAFARSLGMGGVQIAADLNTAINSENPAAYSKLLYTVYEGGVNFIQYDFKTNGSQYKTNTGALAYFDFAFPIKQGKWGLGFGLSPYSSVGYNVTERSTNIYGDYEKRVYKGSGGLNSFHIGTGFKIGRHFSFGLNSEYIFGSINNTRTVEFNSTNYLLSFVNQTTSVGWFHFNTGLQFAFDSLKWGKSDSLAMWDKMILNSRQRFDSLLKADDDSIQLMESRIKVLNDSLSKIVSVPDANYELKNSVRQQIAEAESLKKNLESRKNNDSWKLKEGADLLFDPNDPNSDYKNTLRQNIASAKQNRKSVVNRSAKSDWKLVGGLIFSPQADLRARTSYLGNSFKYALGDSTIVVPRDTSESYTSPRSSIRIPISVGAGIGLRKGTRWFFGTDVKYTQWSNFTFMGQDGGLVNSLRGSIGIQYLPNERALKSYSKVIQYRAGFYYENSYLKLNGAQLNDMGVTLGLSLPIRRTGTLLHIAGEAGRRGTIKNNLIEENYIRLTFGFTINDRWFIKAKYD